MHLFPISDLHINFYNDLYRQEGLKQLFNEFDNYNDLVVCCCGDIGERVTGFLFMQQLVAKFPHIQVVYVLGNHEYYDSVMSGLEQDLLYLSAFNPKIHMLTSQRPIICINDIVFIGNTLWTDLMHENDNVMNTVQRQINDFRAIRTSNGFFKPSYMTNLFGEQRKQIFTLLDRHKDKKKVVLTHHQPLLELSPEPITDPSTYAYFADCRKDMNKCENLPEYWFSGHTHRSSYKELSFKNGSTTFVSNCYGYPHECMTGYSIDCIFEI